MQRVAIYARTFTDEGISGTKGRDRRPAFDRLMKGITRREFYPRGGLVGLPIGTTPPGPR